MIELLFKEDGLETNWDDAMGFVASVTEVVKEQYTAIFKDINTMLIPDTHSVLIEPTDNRPGILERLKEAEGLKKEMRKQLQKERFHNSRSSH